MSRGPAAAIGARVRLPSLPSPRGAVRWLIAISAAIFVVFALYLLWFRDSSFVSVEKVTVQGASGDEAERLRASLVSIARSMSTLNVDRQKLDDVAAGYPVVRRIEVTPDFPHTLHIRVIEHVPAAIALVGGARVPVAADGTVLRGVEAKGALPEIQARDGLDGERLADPRARRAAAVAGAAPTVLRRRVEDVTIDPERGLVAQLKDGPEIVFGDVNRLEAKWIAAARVLADQDAQGASYVDVRLPTRPAVGGLSAAASVEQTPTYEAPTTSEPTTTPDPAATAATTPPATVIDPNTGRTVDAVTGQPIDPNEAPTTSYDPATGQPIDPAAQAPAAPTDGTTTYTQP